LEGEGFGGSEGGEVEGEGVEVEVEVGLGLGMGEDKDRREDGKSLKGTRLIKIPRIAKTITEATWSPYV
jgi:hypothetical protein